MLEKIVSPIGILGGTFDPVHNGHVHIAHSIQQALSLKQVQFLPCYQPVHKGKSQANSQQRVAMLQLALQVNPAFSVNLIEVDSQQPRYTINTLRKLYDPNQPLCFLLGMDSWCQLTTWKAWSQLTDYAHLVVCARPGYVAQQDNNDIINAWMQSRLTEDSRMLRRVATQQKPGHVLFYLTTNQAIDSRDLRQRIQNGENCQPYLPSAVWDYILTHRLYTQSV